MLTCSRILRVRVARAPVRGKVDDDDNRGCLGEEEVVE